MLFAHKKSDEQMKISSIDRESESLKYNLIVIAYLFPQFGTGLRIQRWFVFAIQQTQPS